jgi:hypothetical protein
MMDDANINNEDDQQQQAEQERIAAAAAAAAAARRRRLKLISVLEGFDEFSFRTRNKTDELVEDFLDNLGDDIHDTLCDNDIKSDNYRGLDSERDTEEEVETAIRLFPEVLSRRGGYYNYYPIQLLAFARNEDGHWVWNLKAVSFIPLLVMLAIEFGLFEEEERGGLLCEIGNNVLRSLISSYRTEIHKQERHEAIEDKYLHVLIQLRRIGLFKKEDIQRHTLLNTLCTNCLYFPEKRFRFLAEWDPNALINTNTHGHLLLHCAACRTSIQVFRSIFEVGIRYFPKKEGISLLFRKDDLDETPFQDACKKFGYKEVIKVIEETLIDHRRSDDESGGAPDGPYNIVDALITACIDGNIHLDSVYFLLRREPDVLQKLLPSSLPSPQAAESVASVASVASVSGVDDNSNGNIIDDSKDNRKRKRG